MKCIVFKFETMSFFVLLQLIIQKISYIIELVDQDLLSNSNWKLCDETNCVTNLLYG